MTKAERALLNAAVDNWVTGRFKHLIMAVIHERKDRAKCRVVRKRKTR